MKRNNYINFDRDDHFSIGASETIPNLTLPVHEMMEKLTDHTLDGIRAKSMLYGENFPVDPKADPLEYADKLCLAETSIDLTDISRIKAEIGRQIEVMKRNARTSPKMSNTPVTKNDTPNPGTASGVVVE